MQVIGIHMQREHLRGRTVKWPAAVPIRVTRWQPFNLKRGRSPYHVIFVLIPILRLSCCAKVATCLAEEHGNKRGNPLTARGPRVRRRPFELEIDPLSLECKHAVEYQNSRTRDVLGARQDWPRGGDITIKRWKPRVWKKCRSEWCWYRVRSTYVQSTRTVAICNGNHGRCGQFGRNKWNAPIMTFLQHLRENVCFFTPAEREQNDQFQIYSRFLLFSQGKKTLRACVFA